MKNTRIIIETTQAKKAALESALRERGETLTNWFHSIAEEETEFYDINQLQLFDDVSDLNDFTSSEEVFSKLADIDWAFTNDDTSYLSHNIHPYPAKFIPHIPRTLITKLSRIGETVWDPFGGCGTTALESLLLGRQAISSDVNPIAEVIGKAKTLTLTKEEDTVLVNFIDHLYLLGSDEVKIHDTIKRNRTQFSQFIPNIPNVDKWFHPQAIDELAYLRWRIEHLDSPHCKILARASFSRIVVKASFQDGETRYASKIREIPAGWVVRTFCGDLGTVLRKIRSVSHLLRFREAVFKTADLRHEQVIEPHSVDLVVTSPPYPNATDYHLYHRFRLFWLGFDPRTLAKKEIGSHLRHQKEDSGIDQYLSEMAHCLNNMFVALRPGRYAVLVVGDAIFQGTVCHTADLLKEHAQTVGFEVLGTIQRQVHRTKRSFISPARRLKTEHLLVLRKPSATIAFKLLAPPYKLWPYEVKIRQLEIESTLHQEFDNDMRDPIFVEIDASQVDRLRRLTFTHGFMSKDFSQESTWQAILENGDAFSVQSCRKDPKYVTHGIHEYKGKFYPQLAKSLFNLAQLEPGQTVLDPFCGSGTVLLEAYLNGLKGIGFDLNPLAVKIACVKTSILSIDPYLCDKLLTQFIEYLQHISPDDSHQDIFPESCLSEIKSWFPEPVVNKIGWLLQELNNFPEPIVRELLEISLSNIVRRISQQDPQDLRIRRRKIPLEDAPVRELYERQLIEQRERLRKFAKRANKAPFRFLESQAFRADCRKIESLYGHGLQSNSVDAIVTSPPYATALPYIDTDRLSILLLFGMKSTQRGQLEEYLTGSREIKKRARLAFEEKITSGDYGIITSSTAKEVIFTVYTLNHNTNVGFRRKNMAALLYRYYADMTQVFQNLHTVVAKGGSIFIVIGNNKTKAGGQSVLIPSTEILKETGLALGWTLVDTIPITVTKENRKHNKNSITENDILWFKKSV